MASTIEVCKNLDIFFKSTKEFLYSKEDKNNYLIGTIEKEITRNQIPPKDQLLFVGKQGGQVVWAGLHFLGQPLMMTEGPSEFLSLAAQKMNDQAKWAMIFGPQPTIEQVLVNLGKENFSVAFEHKFYRLDQVIKPKASSGGKTRLAETEDIEKLAQWLEFFKIEVALPEKPDLPGSKVWARQHIQHRTIYVWENENEIVAMASLTGHTRNGVRVAAVYTDPNKRGMGFAKNLTADISQIALNQGKKFCLLYTDIHNAESNLMYQKIGYQEIGTSAMYSKKSAGIGASTENG